MQRIFFPKSVAAVGATEREGRVGRSLIWNLLTAEPKATIYPVNLKYQQVFGRPCFKALDKLPEVPDLVVIATPQRSVIELVDQCGKLGVGGVVILTAGFKEAGKAGQVAHQKLVQLAEKYNLPIIGPNCLGIMNPLHNLNATFANRMALKGRIAFISQSGALCSSILDWAAEENVGFSFFVSVGDMINVGFADLIDYFGMQGRTSSILMYMESLQNARKFMSASRAFARTKPILVLKSGKSQEGARATQSHTGARAGNNTAFDAAFRRAGIVRVDKVSELFNCAKALAMQPLPRDNRLLIISNAGGPGVLATDRLIDQGGRLAPLSSQIRSQFNELLKERWSKNNPIDLRGDAGVALQSAAFDIARRETQADGLLILFAPQGITDALEVAKEVVKLKGKTDKPILAVWMGEMAVHEARNALEQGGIPVYRYPESAVDVFMYMWQYAENLKLLHQTPPSIPSEFRPDRQQARKIIEAAYENGRQSLSEQEAKALLAAYEIPVLNGLLATSATAAKRLAAQIGFPVAMKAEGYHLVHKTECGGVELHIQNQNQAAEAFTRMVEKVRTRCPQVVLQGVSIAPMVDYRYELIIGAQKDPIFGPIILFGMGGIAVELFKDQNVGLPPLNMALAMRMIENTKIYHLLKGYRGEKGVDLNSIQFLLYKFAYLVMDFPEIQNLEINPFVVKNKGGLVLDAKATLTSQPPLRLRPSYEHLVISPYPDQYVKQIQLKNGQAVTLRPIRPEDEPLEVEMFELLSKESVYYRFFGHVARLTQEMLIRFTHIDYDREMAIVAEIEENGRRRLIGVVRIVGDAWNEQAEYAIVVADPWHGQGLGAQLTEFILEIAAEMGFQKVFATLLNSNKGMRRIFERFGFQVRAEDYETLYAEKVFPR